MAPSRKHFHEFREHTLLKHAIFRNYVGRWVHILLFHYPRLRIVDACAGCGQDDNGTPGSPLIAIDVVDRAVEFMREHHNRHGSVEVWAIEKKPKNFRQLRELVPPPHKALLGTLEDYLPQLEQDFARVPHLFFIDPFGLDPLRADVVRRALAGPRNEVFLLFADVAALRHAGAADAMAAIEAPREIDLFSAMNLPSDPKIPSESLAMTAESAERIMDAAYGEMDWRAVRRSRDAMLALYCEFLRSAGAVHVFPIPILDGRGRHKYHLIYATKAGIGLEVMKEAVDKGLRDEVIGATPSQIIQLGTQANVREVATRVRERFAGQPDVPWTEKKPECIKKFVLRDTGAMPAQLQELQELLRSHRLPGKKARYTFPASSAAGSSS